MACSTKVPPDFENSNPLTCPKDLDLKLSSATLEKKGTLFGEAATKKKGKELVPLNHRVKVLPGAMI